MPDVTALTRTLQSKAAKGRTPFIIALDGRSGVGKSTLAAALAKSLPAQIIQGDDFYAGGTDLTPRPPSHLADICINWRKLKATLETLRSSRTATFAPFDWQAFNGTLSDTSIAIPAAPILLLEGVYAARAELRDLVDLTILLTLPDKTRLQRLTAREGRLTDWEHQWHRAEDWYFATSLPPVDIEVDGSTL